MKGTGSDRNYSGVDNLEAMAEAVKYNEFLLDLVWRHIGAKEHVLDFGAGIGTFAESLRARGMSVACLETDPVLAEMLANRGFVVFRDLSRVGHSSLDAVFSLNVLEHIEDDLAALTELNKRMRPGATLLIYVPAFQVLYSSMDRKVGHFRRYRRGQLTRLAVQAGFRVEKSRYADCLGFGAALLYKLIGNDTGEIDRTALRVYDRFIFPLSRSLDTVLGFFFGKNLFVVAVKPN